MSELRLKTGLAEMLKGGVIMDVTNAEQASIAEEAGAVAVMALERVPADIRKQGGVALPGDRRISMLGLRSRETTNITPDAEEDVEGSAKIFSRNNLAAATLVSPIGRASSTTIVSFSRNTDLIRRP